MKSARRCFAAVLACILSLALCGRVFTSAHASPALIVPLDSPSIPDQTYYGDVTLNTVIIPEGITSIGSLAFADSSVSVLTLPSTLTYIAEDAFQGTNLVTVNTRTGTYARSWARDHGFYPEYKALLIGEKTFLDYNQYTQTFYISTANRNVGDVNNMSAILSSVYAPSGGRFSVSAQTDLTYSEVRSAIQSVFSGTKPQDVCLFFIATHGNDAGDGDLFMTFKGDYENADDRNEYYHGNQLLSFATLASWLNEACGGKVVVIIEACGSGSAIYSENVEENSAPAIPTFKASSPSLEAEPETYSFNPDAFNQAAVSAFAAADPGIIIPSAGTGRLRSTGDLRTEKFYVLTAARHHEMSYGVEGEHAQNFFTKWLIEGIGNASSSPADLSPADQMLTLDELFAYIRDNYNDYAIDTWPDGTELHQHVQCYPRDCAYPVLSLVNVPKDIRGAVVSGLSGLEYTGSAIEPEITVELGDDLLLAGTDFDPVWADNTLPGIASLMLTGKGNYTGISETEFTIEKKILTEDMVLLPETDEYVYDGTEKQPEPEVMHGEILLTAGTDYIVSYENNIHAGSAEILIEAPEDSYYTGSLSIPFAIDPADIANAELQIIPSVAAATGHEVTPWCKVILPNWLEATGIITFSDNVLPGTAAAVFTGTEDFTGELTGSFTLLDPESLEQFLLPNDLAEIEESAFEGLSVRYVILPDGTTSIGARAFADCKDLLLIRIPSSVTEISEDAFTDCNGLTIVSPEGSTAQLFVETNGEEIGLLFSPEP